MSNVITFPGATQARTVSGSQLLTELGRAVSRLPHGTGEFVCSRQQVAVLCDGLRLLGGVDRAQLPLLSAALAHVSMALDAAIEGEMRPLNGTSSQNAIAELKRDCA